MCTGDGRKAVPDRVRCPAMKKQVNPVVAVLALLAVLGIVGWYMMSKTQYDPGTFQGVQTAKPKK